MEKYLINVAIAGAWTLVVGLVAALFGNEPNYLAVFLGAVLGAFLPDYWGKK